MLVLIYLFIALEDIFLSLGFLFCSTVNSWIREFVFGVMNKRRKQIFFLCQKVKGKKSFMQSLTDDSKNWYQDKKN